jgi:ribonuclease P protein component
VQRTFRLTRSDDFEAARRSGRSYPHRLLVLVARPNGTPLTRVGVVAGRAVGGAVKRNRAKRVLRAAMRSLFGAVPQGWDLVLIARAPLLATKQAEVIETLAALMRRAGVVLAS